MRKFFLSLLTLLLFATNGFSQYKTLNLFFPDFDTIYEKNVTLHYSIYGITNAFYERYTNSQITTKNHLSFQIPDSVPTFLIVLNSRAPYGYNWSRHILLKMQPGEELSIFLDTLQPPKFEGDNASLHKFITTLRNGAGFERADQTLDDFMENQFTNSFYDFVNQRIEKHINILDSLLSHKAIDTMGYRFAKNLLIDEYLFRTGMMGSLSDSTYHSSKISVADLQTDIAKLFTRYEIGYNWTISHHDEARLRASGLIPGSRLDLGLDFIYPNISYLSEGRQEKVVASVIIAHNAVGMLDSAQLNEQRNAFKVAFPNSIYNPVLERLEPLQQMSYMFASYSIKNGFRTFGAFQTRNLREITGMFMGRRPVLIGFWATWCAPCIREFGHMADFKAFAQEHNIGMLYVSIDFPGAYEAWKRRIKQSQPEGFHFFGTNEFATNSAYFTTDMDWAIPRYMLLNYDGTILIERTKLPSSGELIPQIKKALEL